MWRSSLRSAVVPLPMALAVPGTEWALGGDPVARPALPTAWVVVRDGWSDPSQRPSHRRYQQQGTRTLRGKVSIPRGFHPQGTSQASVTAGTGGAG